MARMIIPVRCNGGAASEFAYPNRTIGDVDEQPMTAPAARQPRDVSCLCAAAPWW